MTSPPYWGKREYEGGGIGLEADYRDFIVNVCSVFGEVRRVLKPTGSFWLNIGDSYRNKNLLGIPWRVAFVLTDVQGWILRNSVVWNKIKGGPDNTGDRLRTVHEMVFHFVKMSSGYYYDADAVRSTPGSAKVVNGAIVSATGVSGVRYRRQIELSSDLSPSEKAGAFAALEEMLRNVSAGRLADFRMIIRGQQRTTHSDSGVVSGRARELKHVPWTSGERKGRTCRDCPPAGVETLPSKPAHDRVSINNGCLTSLDEVSVGLVAAPPSDRFDHFTR